MFGAEAAQPAVRLAPEPSRMQAAAALPTSAGARRVGEIAIDGEQKIVESGIGQKRCVQRSVLLNIKPTAMAKPGRNDRCPCGSGKKYKQCCLTKDEAAERAGLAEAAAVGRRSHMEEFDAMLAAIVAGAGADDLDQAGDPLMASSNAVLDLIRAGKLNEAEAAARALLAHYPDVHDGWDRLGMVHEARCENALAADCYRNVIEFLDREPDNFEPAFRQSFVERIAKLDPPPAT